MKKNLALLLAVILVFTSLLGLTAAAEGGAKATAPSLEVEYTNVSLKVGATLLFAVPSAGHYIQADGTVDGLRLLVFEQSGANGVFAVADAMKSGEVLEASGHTEINGKDYIIFSYSGLAASQMTETVYFRTVYTYGGKRVYGDIGTYSVAEFAKRYPENGKYASLVNSMLKYGDAAAEAYNVATNFKASEAKDLLTIKVKRVLDGVALDDAAYTTQLVKSGVATTLEIPFVDGATYTSVSGATLSSGKITVTKDTELTINYETKADLAVYDFTDATLNDYISTDYEGNPAGAAKYTSAITKLSSGWPGAAGYNIGANQKEATSSKTAYACYKIVGDESNKYMRFASNGASQATFPQFITADRKTCTGIGDTVGFTFEIDIMAGKDNYLPPVYFKIDRVGGVADQTSNGEIILFDLLPDGSVALGGQAVKFGDIESKIIAEKISSTDFQRISVYYDPAEMLVYGYLDGKLTAVSDVYFSDGYKGFNGDGLNDVMDAGKNTRFQVAMYGGYDAGHWQNYGIPASLVDAGHYTATESAEGAFVKDSVSGLYRKIVYVGSDIAEEDKDATRYNVVYNASAEGRQAIIDYVEANNYFFYDNVRIGYGESITK